MTRIIRPRVDRIDELKVFNRLARGEENSRIVLIRAESGMGKSELLREIKSQFEKEVVHVFVDFKGGGLNLADILFNICDALGWKKFPALTSAIRNIVQPVNVNIKGNYSALFSEKRYMWRENFGAYYSGYIWWRNLWRNIVC